MQMAFLLLIFYLAGAQFIGFPGLEPGCAVALRDATGGRLSG
jgi:hypothetical protein